MWLLFCILTLKPADEKQHGKRGAGLHVWKFVWEWACCWIRRATINLYLSDRGESARQSVRPWYICLPGRRGADTALNMCDKKRVLLSFLLGFPLLIRSPAVSVVILCSRGAGGEPTTLVQLIERAFGKGQSIFFYIPEDWSVLVQNGPFTNARVNLRADTFFRRKTAWWDGLD